MIKIALKKCEELLEDRFFFYGKKIYNWLCSVPHYHVPKVSQL